MRTNLVERQLQMTTGDVIRGVGMLLISATLVIAGVASAGSLLLSVLRQIVFSQPDVIGNGGFTKAVSYSSLAEQEASIGRPHRIRLICASV
jgi:hypothetical protein